MLHYSSLLEILGLAVLVAATSDPKSHKEAKFMSNSPGPIRGLALMIVPVAATEPIATVLTRGIDVGATSSTSSTKSGSSTIRTLDDLGGVCEVDVVIIRTIDMTVSPELKTRGTLIIKTTAPDSGVGKVHYDCGAVNGCASLELLFQGRNGSRIVRQAHER